MIHRFSTPKPTLSIVPLFLFGTERGACVLDGDSWLMRVRGLHEAARESLALKGQAAHLLSRDPDYFLNLLEGKTGHMVGTLVDGTLAAQCAVVPAESGEAAKRQGVLSCPETLLKNAGVWATPLSVIQALAVDPVRQGQHLAIQTLAHAYKVSRAQLCGNDPKIVAQVALGNRCSLKKFFEAGFCLEGLWGEKSTDGQKKTLAKVLFCSMSRDERSVQVAFHARYLHDVDAVSSTQIAQGLRLGLRIVPFREGDKCRLAFCERKPVVA